MSNTTNVRPTTVQMNTGIGSVQSTAVPNIRQVNPLTQFSQSGMPHPQQAPNSLGQQQVQMQPQQMNNEIQPDPALHQLLQEDRQKAVQLLRQNPRLLALFISNKQRKLEQQQQQLQQQYLQQQQQQQQHGMQQLPQQQAFQQQNLQQQLLVSQQQQQQRHPNALTVAATGQPTVASQQVMSGQGPGQQEQISISPQQQQWLQQQRQQQFWFAQQNQVQTLQQQFQQPQMGGHPDFLSTAQALQQAEQRRQLDGTNALIQQAMQLQYTGIVQNDASLQQLFQSMAIMQQQGQYQMVNQVQQKPNQQQDMLPNSCPQQAVMQQVRSPQTANNSFGQVCSPNPNPSPRPQFQPAPSPRAQPSPCPCTAGGLQMNSPHHPLGEPMQTDQQPMLMLMGAMPNVGHTVNSNPGLN